MTNITIKMIVSSLTLFLCFMCRTGLPIPNKFQILALLEATLHVQELSVQKP